MTNQTLFFDLTNPEIVQYIKNLSIEDLMLDNTDSDSKGTYRPFNIIFKMEGLFAKRKPKYWEIFNQFRESNYPFRFVALFVDEYKDKDFTGKDECRKRGIQLYFNSRDHRFSTSDLRMRVCQGDKNAWNE